MKNNGIYEFLGIIVFFAVYIITKNIYYATGVSIVLSVVQVIVELVRFKSVDKKLLLSTVLIIVLGGMTILLHNDLFIRIKPTVLYWIFALVLLISQLFGRNLIKKMLQAQVDFVVSDKVWNRYVYMWVVFFVILGVANLYVAMYFSLDYWVKFKLFGTSGLMILFMLVQGALLMKEKKNN